MDKKLKKIEKQATGMIKVYLATDVYIDDSHTHPWMVATMVTGEKVICTNLPNTSNTEVGHIAQNAMKRIREGYRCGDSMVCYGGGKK